MVFQETAEVYFLLHFQEFAPFFAAEKTMARAVGEELDWPEVAEACAG